VENPFNHYGIKITPNVAASGWHLCLVFRRSRFKSVSYLGGHG